jgi:sterol desaturase/sphingolipid hydroxylase (fatty acid hydroxylase superfamily)
MGLAVISLGVAVAERIWPWRPQQRALRAHLGADVLHLIFNGHFLGVILYALATRLVLPPLDALLRDAGLYASTYRAVAADWPLWAQLPVALLVSDFMQYWIHRLLHRVPLLWETHKTHHSVPDGEMDWIVAFRFQWTEVVVYRVLQYLPLAFFGFGADAVMAFALFGTLIGHINHANLNVDYGPLRYLLNNPRMHVHHHDRARDGRSTVNYGVVLSCWDYLFGTAHVPADPPAHIGFVGDERFPRGFFAQEAWPLSRIVRGKAASFAGAALIALGLLLAY